MYRQAQKANNRGANQHQLQSSDPTAAPTLDQLGVSKDQSSSWQKLAEVSDKQFEAALNKASQARNIESERQCAEIRIRAERRWGQMHRQAQKATGNQHMDGAARSGDSTKHGTPTLDQLGISKDQSSSWQKLAHPLTHLDATVAA